MKYPILAFWSLRLGRWSLLLVLFGIIFMPRAGRAAASDVSEPHPTSKIQQDGTGIVWTVWDRDLRSISAGEPGVLWLGGTGGIIRFDLATKTYERISSADGLPHYTVNAIAIDGQQNRWYGGDGGLSRLDAQGRWRHYNSQNSGLYTDSVAAIAIDDEGTLWASHAIPDGPVSRREPAGAWRVFGNMIEAVNQDYERIVRTKNANRLWTVVGTDVWVGYQVFDGTEWSERKPVDTEGDWPAALVSDKVENVWIVDEAEVYQWDGNAWQEKARPPAEITGINGMTVIGNQPWIAWTRSGYPFGDEGAHVAPLDPTPQVDDGSVGMRGPVIGLETVDDKVAAIGDGWILHPDGSVVNLSDLPRYRDMVDAFHLVDDVVWVYSRFQHGPTDFDEMYELHHQGTPTLADDVQLPISIPSGDAVALLEPGAGRDVWAITSDYPRGIRIDTPYQWSNGHWNQFPLPQENLSSYFSVTRIYVENERSVWYLVLDGSAPVPAKTVFHLSIGDSVQDTSDDAWTDYPVDVDGDGGGIAVDLQGRLLFFNSSGLYRNESGRWRPLYQETGVCEVVPVSSGEILVAAGDEGDCMVRSQILVRGETGDWDATSLQDLCRHRYELLQSARHPNRYWSVANDGTVWYPYQHRAGEDETNQLRHCSDRMEEIYRLPFDAITVARIQVNGYGQPWLFESSGYDQSWFFRSGRTWRMSTTPDFHIEVSPVSQLALPGDATKVMANISALNGFAETVTVDIEAVADGITAAVDPVAAMPGERVTVSLTLESELPTGLYVIDIVGDSSVLSHAAQATISVVEELDRRYLPAISAR